jgi:hypothetical protein
MDPGMLPQVWPFARGPGKLTQTFKRADETIAIGNGLLNPIGYNRIAGDFSKVIFRGF